MQGFCRREESRSLERTMNYLLSAYSMPDTARSLWWNHRKQSPLRQGVYSLVGDLGGHEQWQSWKFCTFVHGLSLEQRARGDCLSRGNWEGFREVTWTWVVLWRMQRSSLSFWKWKGPEKTVAIWSGRTQPFWSSDLHYTLSFWCPASKLCSEQFFFFLNLQGMSFNFFMKDAANQTSLNSI